METSAHSRRFRQQLGEVSSTTAPADLAAVVTGLEHSGTTYFSRLLNSHPNISSGFECGIFLGNLSHFGEVHPFSDWLKLGESLFGLPSTYLEDIKNMTYAEVVVYINKNKGSHDGEQQADVRSGSMYVDKTPSYMRAFPEIYHKIKSIGRPVPIFIVLKSFDQFYHSYSVKRNFSDSVILERAKVTIRTLTFVKENSLRDVYVFLYEEVITHEANLSSVMMNILIRYHPSLKKVALRDRLCFQDAPCESNLSPVESKTYANMDLNVAKKTYDGLLNSLKISS